MTQSGGSWNWSLKLVGALAIGAGIAAFSGEYALAQIQPDTTLGSERSAVTRNVNIKGLPSDQIDGGARRGANLFHSFEEFNIKEGQGAYFSNPAGIENILSRVTGNNPSDIQGTLGVLGKANLFLINPKGIIFGPNASLDVNGSFVGTTADAIQFDNQGFFDTSEPNSPPLLTVNPSAFLFNQIAHGSIENNSIAPAGVDPSGTLNTFGLRVPDGQSLLLVGGDVTMNSGGLFAFGGRVELGGVTGAGTVGLNGGGNNLSLGFPNSVGRSDVSLSNFAGVDVAANDGGSITVNARNLEMTGRSFLSGGIGTGLGSNTSQAGDIEVNATGAINLNNESFIGNQVLAEANGQGGDVNISTSTLQVQDGAQVLAGTFGEGNGGRLSVDAQNVLLIGASAKGQSGSALRTFTQPNSTGNAGDLTLKANNLVVLDGAALIASTRGQGDAGNIRINARDRVFFKSSAAFSTVESEARGNAGDINVNTGSLLMADGAALVTSTRGEGDAGSVTINARDQVFFDGEGSNEFTIPNFRTLGIGRIIDVDSVTINILDDDMGEPDLSPSGVISQVESEGVGRGGRVNINARSSSITNGAVLAVSTSGKGNAGSIFINANTFEADGGGQVQATTSSDSNAGNITINTADDYADSVILSGSTSGLLANTTSNSKGRGGSISVYPAQLTIVDGAGIAVDSQGEGSAGSLLIQADLATLSDGAFLSAAAESGEGGNIDLQVQDLLLMRQNSLISAVSKDIGKEGNITINTDLLVALENSDIVANAFKGQGANVQISAQGIVGTQPSEQLTSKSDLTTSSQLRINAPDVNPTQGVVALPDEVVDVSGLVVQKCPAGGGTVAKRASKFVVTGRGGLPPNPSDPPNGDVVLANWITLDPEMEETSSDPAPIKRQMSSEAAPIVEAQGWVKDSKGQIVLTAQAPTVTPQSSGLAPVSCRKS